MALHQCEVFQEHIHQNRNDLGMTETSALKLYYDDFKLMNNECKACLRSTIDLTRLRKRFSILLSVLKNIEKTLEARNAHDGKTDRSISIAANKPFTFGEVTAPNNSKHAPIEMKSITDSLEMAIDLDEFISRDGSVMHGSVFYDTKRKHCPLKSFVQNSSKSNGDLYSRKDGITPKRASKRMQNYYRNETFFGHTLLTYSFFFTFQIISNKIGRHKFAYCHVQTTKITRDSTISWKLFDIIWSS